MVSYFLICRIAGGYPADGIFDFPPAHCGRSVPSRTVSAGSTTVLSHTVQASQYSLLVPDCTAQTVPLRSYRLAPVSWKELCLYILTVWRRVLSEILSCHNNSCFLSVFSTRPDCPTTVKTTTQLIC